MKSYVVFLVVVNALSCLAGPASKLQLDDRGGCVDLQEGILVGTPLGLSYFIPPQVTDGYIDIYRDFYSQCPYGPNSVFGVYVKSCETSPDSASPALAMVFERSPADQIDVYRSYGALTGFNYIQVTVYCGFEGKLPQKTED